MSIPPNFAKYRSIVNKIQSHVLRGLVPKRLTWAEIFNNRFIVAFFYRIVQICQYLAIRMCILQDSVAARLKCDDLKRSWQVLVVAGFLPCVPVKEFLEVNHQQRYERPLALRTQTHFGKHIFCVCGLCFWNPIPHHIRNFHLHLHLFPQLGLIDVDIRHYAFVICGVARIWCNGGTKSK